MHVPNECSLLQVKPVNDSEKETIPEVVKKDDEPAEKPNDDSSKVNNVDGEKNEKSLKDNSIVEKPDAAASDENKSPSEEAAPAKGVAQEPVSVSQ